IASDHTRAELRAKSLCQRDQVAIGIDDVEMRRVGFSGRRAEIVAYSESRRGVDPKDDGIGCSGILPTLRRPGREIKTVACSQLIFTILEKNVEPALDQEEKFLAFVRIGFDTACARSDAEQVRLHGDLAPSQKLHPYTGSALERFAAARAHQRALRGRRIEEIEDVLTVILRELVRDSGRGSPLRALQIAKESNRNLQRARHCRQRFAALQAKLPQSRSDRRRLGARTVARAGQQAILAELIQNRGRVQAAYLPK